MSNSADEIRSDIERTRQDLGMDVDALADKVTPSKIVDRQMGKVRGAFGSVRDRVMGAADDAGSSISDAGAHAGDVKDRVVAKAEGNPLAVGLIAFGAGLVLASLFPASSKEKEIASTVKDQAQPLIDEATDVAKEVGEHLKEPLAASVDSVTSTTKDSVAAVKEEAQYAASEVKHDAQDARDNVANS
jgi:gas vesicle protein